jgi:hypothetical protein
VVDYEMRKRTLETLEAREKALIARMSVLQSQIAVGNQVETDPVCVLAVTTQTLCAVLFVLFFLFVLLCSSDVRRSFRAHAYGGSDAVRAHQRYVVGCIDVWRHHASDRCFDGRNGTASSCACQTLGRASCV